MPASAAMRRAIWLPASDRKDNAFTLFLRSSSSSCGRLTAVHFWMRTFCGCSSAWSDNNGSGSEDGRVRSEAPIQRAFGIGGSFVRVEECEELLP